MSQRAQINTSVLGSSLRGWRGTMVTRPVQFQPAKPLSLYDIEANTRCRRVREALTEMDLDALILPCPAGGSRFRLDIDVSAKYPYLIDPNAGIGLSEPKDIIDYLADIYDALPVTTGGLLRQFDAVSGALANRVRGHRGSQARKSFAPQQPLELFSFESSPYSRLVREVLCELELPYWLRNAGKARWSDMGPPVVRDKLLKAPKDTGRNRKLLYERTGKVQFPYLIDPNTGAEMFESAAIVDYLETRYAR